VNGVLPEHGPLEVTGIQPATKLVEAFAKASDLRLLAMAGRVLPEGGELSLRLLDLTQIGSRQSRGIAQVERPRMGVRCPEEGVLLALGHGYSGHSAGTLLVNLGVILRLQSADEGAARFPTRPWRHRGQRRHCHLTHFRILARVLDYLE